MNKRNRILCLASVIVMLVGLMSVMAIPAAADSSYPYPGNYEPEEGYYYIRKAVESNQNTQSYLAAYKPEGKSLMYHTQSQGDLFRLKKFQISTAKGEERHFAYKIIEVKSSVAGSGEALRVPGVSGHPQNNTAVDAGSDSFTWFPYWAFDKDDNGNIYIRSYLDKGIHRCLDFNEGRCCLWDKNSSRTTQLWKLDRVNYIPDGIEGDGSEAKPYLISDAAKLGKIAECVANGSNYAGLHFKLTQDITYNGSPIGAEFHPFCGIFDGNGKTINATIDCGNNNNIGLFSYLSNATVKNLTVAGTVKGGASVAGIAGYAYDNTVIDNCRVTADIVGTDVNIGGIAGGMDTSTVSNCIMEGSVTSSGWTSFGGIVGGIINDGKIINCVNKGKVTGWKAVGGILGCVLYGDPVIVNCASLGSTEKNASGGYEHGGIVGFIGEGVKSMTIKGCFSSCSVGVESDSGYIIGNHNDGAAPIYCDNVYYLPFGSATGVVGVGNAEQVNAEQITVEKLAEKMSVLTNYANGKNEAGVNWTAWKTEGDRIAPISFVDIGKVDEQVPAESSTETTGKVATSTSSTISTGDIIIIAVVAVFAVGAVAALIIVKNKKKPAVASGENSEE